VIGVRRFAVSLRRIGGKQQALWTGSTFVPRGTLMLLGAVAAQPVGYDVPFPSGFRDWFVVNSMIATKNGPMFDQIGRMHIINYAFSHYIP
jgi:hypothetical protein